MTKTKDTVGRGDTLAQTVAHYELSWGVSLDVEKVRKNLINYLQQGVNKNFVEIRNDLDKEKRLGAMLATMLAFSEKEDIPVSTFTAYKTVLYGKDVIDTLDSFWMVKPTLEKVFELRDGKLDQAKEFIQTYNKSGEYYTVNQMSDGLLPEIVDDWNKDSTKPRNIRYGVDNYMKCAQILERTFPLLLGMRKILDGESPDLNDLHDLKSYQVRNKLTDRDSSPNIVYFDCIVNQYDSQLRNGIAHGDILINPTESVIEIPNASKEYKFSEINDILKKNFASMAFLTGMYTASIDLQYIFNGSSLEARELILGD